jgi:hypothetical protein
MKILFPILIFIIASTQLSCDKNQVDSPSNLEKISIKKHETWSSFRFKNGVFIQLPDDYEGRGLSTFEGNTFHKFKKDTGVDISYHYCSPLYCEDFGGTDDQKPIQIQDDNNNKIKLEKSVEFVRDGITEGIFYYNDDISTPVGIYFMKTSNLAFKDAAKITFKKDYFREVLEILSTITPFECKDIIACTEVYVSVQVSFVDKNNKPYKPAKVKVVNEYGEDLYSYPTINNFYVLVSDNHLHQIYKNGSKVTLTAYDISDQVVATEVYQIAHDCCHIQKISGPDEIIIN